MISKTFSHALVLGLVLSSCALSSPIVPFTYTWTGLEPTDLLRVLRNGIASVWTAPKPFPGTLGGGPFSYIDPFAITNPNSFATPLFIAQTGASDNSTFMTLYKTFFNPGSLAANYLGDPGFSCGGSSAACSFSVLVPAGAAAVMLLERASTANPAGQTISFTAQFREDLVPEPGSLLLLVAGLVPLVLRLRWKVRTSA